MVWTIDLQSLAGTTLLSGVEFQDAVVTWTLDGPGSCEVSLAEPHILADWRAGLRRICVRDSGTARFTGWLTHLDRSGRPDNVAYKAAATGLRSALEWRVVHGDVSYTSTAVTTIAWNLIDHAQGQTDGALGFTLGTVTGSPPTRTRYYCDGDRIGEAIGELAAMNPGGFDWEISPAGVFNAWVNGRGVTLGATLADTDCLDFAVNSETADLVTYVTALGDADKPCGPPLVTRSSGLAATYGRREDVVTSDLNIVGELEAAADEMLRIRGAARLQVQATWAEGQGPWAFATVWLGDTVTVTLPAWFGGNQTMRVTEVRASLELSTVTFVTYILEAV